MSDRPDDRPPAALVLDVETEHALRNQIAIIVGFVEVLLIDAEPEDPRVADLTEIHNAAVAAMNLLKRGSR